MPELVDPPEAPEPGTGGRLIKAKDLKNKYVILLPQELAIDEAHPNKDGSPWEFVRCHAWTFDRSGVLEDGETRISWWRSKEQLRDQMGQYVACKPTEQDDNSIILERLDGLARETAGKLIAAGLLMTMPPADEEPTEEEFGSEPF